MWGQKQQWISHKMNIRHLWQLKKIKILGALLELPAKQHCQSSPFTSKLGLIGQNWQCCLADSSQRAPRILIFLIAMGAEYLSYVKSIGTFAPTFYWYIIFFLASVSCHQLRPRLVDLGQKVAFPVQANHKSFKPRQLIWPPQQYSSLVFHRV